MRESLPRDAGVFAERCGSLCREMRESLPRDAGVSTERCGSLRREMRESRISGQTSILLSRGKMFRVALAS
jgi:hypothetical protein